MAGMKVLISGAGIAGNALAFWLSKLGHTVTVLERFPGLRATGLQLDLRGHGAEVMRRMGLEEAFRARQTPEQGLAIVGSSGMRWAYFPANKSGKGLQGLTTDSEIMRGDFCQLLHDATEGRVRYVFGTSVDGLDQEGDGVDVHFEDGTSDRFDLVVGADGQRSRTRKLMVGPDGPEGFRPIGNSCVGYVTIPRPIEEGEGYDATVYTATGGRNIMTRRHSAELTQAYLSCNLSPERLERVRREGVRAQKEAVAEVFRGAGWKADDIVESMMADNDFYLEQLGVVHLESWHRGRVCLVGDAAYCPSANTGMGTTCAVVGAYILAGEIGTHCRRGGGDGVEAALSAYEDRFRPFMTQVQRGLVDGKAFTDSLPQGSLGITLMNCVVAVASLLRVDILSRLVLREDVGDWDLPDYEDMVRGSTSG